MKIRTIGDVKMELLRLRIVEHMCDIETAIQDDYGLKKITRFTLIARDPDNDEMCVVVTNETDLVGALAVGLEQSKK